MRERIAFWAMVVTWLLTFASLCSLYALFAFKIQGLFTNQDVGALAMIVIIMLSIVPALWIISILSTLVAKLVHFLIEK